MFFNDAATTEIYTLSLHDARPIYLALERAVARLALLGLAADSGQLPARRLAVEESALAAAQVDLRVGAVDLRVDDRPALALQDRKSTRLHSSHANISYAVFCLPHQQPRRARRTPGRLGAPVQSLEVHSLHFYCRSVPASHSPNDYELAGRPATFIHSRAFPVRL